MTIIEILKIYSEFSEFVLHFTFYQKFCSPYQILNSKIFREGDMFIERHDLEKYQEKGCIFRP